MSLNSTPSSSRLHISFFGLRNAGKSSVVNAITGQDLCVVSDVLGTTTDPVSKSMELLPLGPVVIIDTAGIDDSGELGSLRVKKTMQVLAKTDIAVLVVDATKGISNYDSQFINMFIERKIPYIIAYNKCDLLNEHHTCLNHEIYISALNHLHIHELKEKIGQLISQKDNKKTLLADIINPEDIVILVIPIDESAPKGRLILPQQQTIRALLEVGAKTLICQDTDLKETLNLLNKKPKLVITDSQVFQTVSKIVPNDIMLTSFSILFARFKGHLETNIKAVSLLDQLNDHDKILISEGCTHHRQCEDIGSVKIPKWILDYSKKQIQFEFTSGTHFPEDLSNYKMVIHCGGCMLNEKEMQHRIKQSTKQKIAFANYGMVIAYLNGILKRSIQPFYQNNKDI